jgi:uncharacterized protein YciI
VRVRACVMRACACESVRVVGVSGASDGVTKKNLSKNTCVGLGVINLEARGHTLLTGLIMALLWLALLNSQAAFMQPLAPPCLTASPINLAAARPGRISMLPRRKKKVEPEDEEETDYEALEREAKAEGSVTSQGRLVDGMVTSLGSEGELEPAPGPNIVSLPDDEGDRRPFYVHFGLFSDGKMPDEALQEAYANWLKAEHASVGVCLPQYMLSAQDFDGFWELGAEANDDDIARLEALEELGPGGDGEALPPPAEMVDLGTQFVIGHLCVVHADDWASARTWAGADPIGSAAGYGETQLHRWVRSDEEALRVRQTGAVQQPYGVYCIDREGVGHMRTATREKHLQWLRESGRVLAAGPLQSEDGEGESVGSLLIVSGDELGEVRGWAAADPYAAAGIFETVTIAPLSTYHVESAVPF